MVVHSSGEELIQKEDLASQVYRVLAHRIVTRDYQPGQRLAIQAIADDFGVSVTPVREAFKRLAHEGLLQIQPRKGTIVTRASEQDLVHLYEIRLLLETHAARQPVLRGTFELMQACVDEMSKFDDERLYEDFELYWDYSSHDARFHRLLIRASGNPRLLEIYDNLHTHSLIAPILFGIKTPGRGVEQRQEHRRILEALAQGDGDAAAGAMQAHLVRTLEVLRQRTPDASAQGRVGQGVQR